ncbi:MAG: DUF2892 domain-containing protein [Marmoricola sp.]
MNTNMGGNDRKIRIGVAVVLAVIAYFVGFGSTLGIIALVLAAVMLVTSAVGFCPLYTLFGINTCKRN